ncbi:MAG: tetratricopeptide repeat protein [Steroidobacteraceae bacterium]
MRAGACSALLLMGVVLLPASGSGAPASQVQQLITRAEKEGFTNPEDLNRDARAALAALQSRPDADLEIRTRLLLCDYDSERDLGAAEDQLQHVFALLPKAVDPGLRAGALTCQGETRETAGDNAQALVLFSQAVEVAGSAHNDEKLAAALYSRGYLLGIQGGYAAGLVDLRRAQVLYDRLGRQYDALSCRDSIATLYSRMGDNTEAAHLYAEVLRMQRQAGMVREQAVTLHNLARVYETPGSGTWRCRRLLRHSNWRTDSNTRGSRPTHCAVLPPWKSRTMMRAGALADLARASTCRAGPPMPDLPRRSVWRRVAHCIWRGASPRVRRRCNRRAASSNPPTRRRSWSTPTMSSRTWRQPCPNGMRPIWPGPRRRRQQEQLLSRQLDQRFAILKVQYDTAAQEQENRALLRQNAATQSALAQSRRVRQLQGIVIGLGVALGAVAHLAGDPQSRPGAAHGKPGDDR